METKFVLEKFNQLGLILTQQSQVNHGFLQQIEALEKRVEELEVKLAEMRKL
jgi:hypothetical protein